MAKRAFTLVELLFVIALTAIVMGTTVGIYAYAVNRLAQSTSRFAASSQVRRLLDEIESVVRDSTSASTVTTLQGPALKCVLATESKRLTGATGGTDVRVSRAADPVSVTKRGYERHGSGKRVWFYQANSSGTFGTVGTYFWRAERNDDSTPVAGDLVSAWSYYPGSSKPRFDLVTNFSATVTPSNRLVTITVDARALWRDERSGSATDKMSQSFSETRTVGWRHWFQ